MPRDDTPPLRLPPSNQEAEMALIGQILYDNRAYEAVTGIVSAEHFYVDVHQRIFTACGKMIQRAVVASPVSLKNYFDQDESLADIGGSSYLGQLAATAVTIINAPDLARAIRDCWQRRELIKIANEALEKAHEFDFDSTADDITAATSGSIAALEGLSAVRKPSTVGDAASDAINRASQAEARGTHISGVRTGFKALDRALGGLEPSWAYVLAGRPGMGKSSLATWIAYHVAKSAADGAENAGPVLFFSHEMGAPQLAARIIGAQCGLSPTQIRVGAIGDAWPAVIEAQADLERLPMIIDDRTDLRASDLHIAAKRVKREQKGLGLVVVDHLGLVRPPADVERAPQHERIGHTMRALRRMAKDLGCPVLVLHQLSRGTEDREDSRPRLSDLRGSGDIEQDADVVMFVYREHYYLSRQPPKRKDRETPEAFMGREADWHEECRRCEHEAEILIEKQRDGASTRVKLFFDAKFARFQNLSDSTDQPGLI